MIAQTTLCEQVQKWHQSAMCPMQYVKFHLSKILGFSIVGKNTNALNNSFIVKALNDSKRQGVWITIPFY